MHVSGWAAASCLLPHTTVKSLCLLCSFWSVPCWWEGMEELKPSLDASEAIPPSTWASPRPVAASRCSLQPHGLSYLLLPPTILLVVFVLRDPNCVLIGSDKIQAEDIVLSLPWLPGLWPLTGIRTLIAIVAAQAPCCCLGPGSAHGLLRLCYSPSLLAAGLCLVGTVIAIGHLSSFYFMRLLLACSSRLPGSLLQALLAVRCQMLHFPVDCYLQTAWVYFASFTKSLIEVLRKPSCCEILSVSASAYLYFEPALTKVGNLFWYL